MSSIQFSDREKITRALESLQSSDSPLASSESELIARINRFLLQKRNGYFGDAAGRKIDVRLRNARRFLMAKELGACAFELDCLAKELDEF